MVKLHAIGNSEQFLQLQNKNARIVNYDQDLTTGSKGYLRLPFECMATRWTLLADQSGSIVVDVKKSSYTNFPTTTSVAGSDLPTLSSAQKNTSNSLTDWGTLWSSGDVLEFYVNSATTVTRVTLSIFITRT